MKNEESYKYPIKNHIHILGASGSGTTTLARQLSKKLSYKHFDSDDFFWNIKYTATNPQDVRLKNLENELTKYDQWILSGAIIDWGNPLVPLFDLVIFISVSNEIRIKRLHEREYERYGEAITPKGNKYKDFLEFMDWADKYETGGIDVRSRYQQEMWLKDLNCPILKINGDLAIDTNVKIIVDKVLGPSTP
ncbi:MAG: AAA family ATPase [Ignavibacteriales bacterium]|nr:AAA family ATPase [Ignavibacteriales bacterium]